MTMKVHWIGKSQNTYLSQNPGAGAQFTPSNIYFGATTADGNPSGGWNPPTSYYVGDDLIMKFVIDTTANPNGIGEGGIPPGTTITVDFIPAHGPPVEEQFITPNDYGNLANAQFIDLTNT
jgi:hypothetical protein